MIFETLIVTIPIFLVTLLVTRRVLFSIFDPFMLTLFALSASLGVMFYISYANRLVDLGTTIMFVLSHIAFVVGLLAGRRSAFRIKRDTRKGMLFLKLSYLDMLLALVLVVLFFCFIIMFRSVGLIILQPDVVAARTTLLTGGYGILKRFLEPGVVLAFALLLVRNRQRRFNPFLFWSCLAFLVVISASLGTKSFLFTFYALFVYYLAFASNGADVRLPRTMRVAAVVLLLLVLGGAVANLMLTTLNSGNLTNDNLLVDALVKLGNRIAGFGDIGYLFFENNAYRILQKSVVDYAGYISNDILGFLRLREYGVSPGAEIYAIVTGSDNPENFGPNAQVYFVGYMFFQALGIFYSFCIGWLFAFIRRMTVRNARSSNADMLLFILINYLITPMGMDLQLVISQTFNMIITMGPLALFSCVLYAFLHQKTPFVMAPIENFTSFVTRRPAATKL